MISILYRLFLRTIPAISFDNEERQNYEKLMSSMISSGNEILYDLPYPKTRFLTYLSQTGKYLFHGSNNLDISQFEPREQTLYNSKLTKAVFAASEPVWSCFYAILDRRKLIGGFRNGCLVTPHKKYHYYSITHETYQNNPWIEGMVYILPKEHFKKSGQGKIQFDEWVCHDHVIPISKLRITIDDFPFRNKISKHKKKESLIKTIVLYKFRTL